MPTNPMYCRRCYADLEQASVYRKDTHDHGPPYIEFRCTRCNRPFNPDQPKTFLPRPFPPRRRIILHTVLNLLLATLISVIIAFFVATAQMRFMHTSH